MYYSKRAVSVSERSEPNANNKKHKNIYIEYTSYTQTAYAATSAAALD
uniref:Uncharacterized protein n=1 Tax=viral metagenome TaxID=1070528 RepID=A0A6C0K5T7_9ZZZZ